MHLAGISTSVGILVSLALSLAGGCSPPDPQVPECSTDADCEASTDDCQQIACVAGKCAVTPTPSGVACDDGLFCTENEICDGLGACGAGRSPCRELVPGLPRCNEAERQCEICTDGRPLVNGECRCPYWNCIARGGATFCSETDVSQENTIGCYYDGLTIDDLPPLLIR